MKVTVLQRSAWHGRSPGWGISAPVRRPVRTGPAGPVGGMAGRSRSA